MGVDDYLLTSTIIGIQAQRLVRRLCTHCKEPYHPVEEVVAQMGLRRFSKAAQLALYKPKGCEHCGHILPALAGSRSWKFCPCPTPCAA